VAKVLTNKTKQRHFERKPGEHYQINCI